MSHGFIPILDGHSPSCRNVMYCQVKGLKKHDTLVKQVREKAGKKPASTVGIIDSQSVETVQKGNLKDMMRARRLKIGNVI